MSNYLENLFPDCLECCEPLAAKTAELQGIKICEGRKTVDISINIKTVDRSVNASVSRFLASRFEGWTVNTEITNCGCDFNSDCFFFVLDKLGAEGVHSGMFRKEGVKVSAESIALPVSEGSAQVLAKLDFEEKFNACCHSLFGRTFKLVYNEVDFGADKEKRAQREAEFKARSLSVKRDRLSKTDVESFGLQLETDEYIPVLGKKPALSGITPMGEMGDEQGKYTLWGRVFKTDCRESRRGGMTHMVWFSDGTSSIVAKRFFKPEESDKTFAAIKEGDVLVVRGNYIEDKWGGLNLRPDDCIKIFPAKRKDLAPEKRVELHLHTNMSALDGMPAADAVINMAAGFGHRAVAITDHGVAQSFPKAQATWEAMKKKGSDFKVIYGMEGYLASEGGSIFTGEKGFELTGEVVVFDVETTGLSAARDRITQIGAVLIRNRSFVDSFEILCDPERPLSSEIVKLTGITNEMLVGAPKEKEAITAFLNFVKNRPLIAHNAAFDMSFITAAAERNGIQRKFNYLDTLELCQRLFPEEKRHRLDVMAKKLGVKQIQHHRADDDARTLGEIYLKLVDILVGRRLRFSDNLDSNLPGRSYKHQRLHHVTMLVKNKVGLKNLYELISKSNIDYFYQKPRIPIHELNQHREGLILGSACIDGQLMEAVAEGQSEDKLLKIASYYDYLEIQPIDNNSFLVEEGRLSDEEELRQLNRTVVALGEKLNKPVVATGDVHYLNREDSLFRHIISPSGGGDSRDSLYFRTTDEMLREFSYLGDEKAYEVVVTNTNLIADMVENGILPIPKGTFAPIIEGAENRLNEHVKNGLKELYGDNVPQQILDRTNRELSAIIKNGFAGLYVIARQLVKKSEEDGYHVGSRGSVGSSFVAHLCGITEVNPLPPHYRCPACKYLEFADSTAQSGFDLPDMLCPKCGKKMVGDGQDIPFETFLGFNGEKAPDIDLNFSSEYQSQAHRYTEEIFGSENVFKAGTISVIQEKKAFGYVRKYNEEQGIIATPAEEERLVAGCVGVKVTTGQHPGGMVVLPKEYDITDFTAVQHPADSVDKGIVTTHFDFKSMHDTLLKLDMLGHEVPTLYKYLENFTGINVNDVPMNDPEVLRMFTSVEPLGINATDIDSGIGTFGIPEMGTSFVGNLLLESNPKTFADLLQVSGLSHGTDVWTNNAQELIKQGVCTISEVIGTRDSIMVYLMKKGVPPATAFELMEYTRKGKALEKFTEEHYAILKECNVPEWYVESCKKIKYMFPKAHAAAYVISAIRLAWFKLHRPVEFYATYFTVRGDDLDVRAALSSPQEAKQMLENLKKALQVSGKSGTKDKDATSYVALQMVCEALFRGIKFLPIDFYKSHSNMYLIEDGALRLPFCALKGVGEAAATALFEAARRKKYLSTEELLLEPGVNRSVVELLYEVGAFGEIPKTNQVSLFGF